MWGAALCNQEPRFTTHKTCVRPPKRWVGDATMKANKRPRTEVGRIRRVAITGGTHGNESNGVQLAKHLIRNPALAQRDSFSCTVLLNNTAAIERNVRYCDEDLNRCFGLADLADESRETLEAKRARELNAQLGPKGSDGAMDYVLDLHNTTANTGVAIMCSPRDPLSHALAAHLQTKDPSVRLILWNRSTRDYPLLPSVAKHGMTFEVGPAPWGCVVGALYEQSLKLIGHALDYLHAHNAALESADGAGWRTLTLTLALILTPTPSLTLTPTLTSIPILTLTLTPTLTLTLTLQAGYP